MKEVLTETTFATSTESQGIAIETDKELNWYRGECYPSPSECAFALAVCLMPIEIKVSIVIQVAEAKTCLGYKQFQLSEMITGKTRDAFTSLLKLNVSSKSPYPYPSCYSCVIG